MTRNRLNTRLWQVLAVAASLAAWLVDGLVAAPLLVAGLIAIHAVVSAVVNGCSNEGFLRELQRQSAGRRAVRSETPGLLMVQIDGLGMEVIERAMRSGRMPVLARWVESGSHRLAEWECGLPSQTSASQAGILYGDNFDIPAFRWFEKDSRRLMISNRPRDARVIAQRLSTRQGLLSPHGASLSSLLDGDAERSVLTMSTLATSRASARYLVACIFSPFMFVREIALSTWEVALELWQAYRQRVRNVRPRVARSGWFPLLRALSCVVLRDLTTALVIDHIHRGAPLVFADFVGYDELAHHAGPERPETLAALEHIDHHIGLIERAARGAPRPYHVVILSDHGQSQGAPFRQRFGLTLEALVQAHMGRPIVLHASTGTHHSWGHLNALLTEVIRVPRHLGSSLLRSLLQKHARQSGHIDLGPDRGNANPDEVDVVVCASGNLGLVYFTESPMRLTQEAIDMAHPGLLPALVDHPGISLVLVRSGQHGPMLLARAGVRYLADDFVEGHDPLAGFGRHAAQHLRRLDSFPHVGDLVVISTLDKDTGDVAAFEEQVGSHGGLGGRQTGPFVLFPAGWDLGEQPVIGAPALHARLRAWRDNLDAQPAALAA